MSEIFIPQIITITDGHEHGVDLESYQFTKERKVKLIGEINAGTARSIVSQLDYLDGRGDDDIHLIINSPGGTVSDGMMIYDAIKHGIHCDVRTVATGMAASMGAFLLAAGTKGKRYAMPNAEVTLYPVSDKGDPFWPESARSVFVAVVLALFEHAPADQVTMASVYQTIAKGEERLGAGTVLKEFVSSLPTNSVAAMLLQSYVSTASDTRAGIRSTFLEGISMFARSEGLIQMLGTDDLHINQLDGMKSTGIFVILPDERPIFDRLAGILCSQIMSHYIRLAQDKYGGKLPLRLNVCLEELGNIGGAISTLPHLMSAGRSRNVRVQCVLQSLSQLVDIYGPSNATTILSNADVMVAFRTNHWDTLTELSRKCGERDVDNGNHASREPLITQSQLSAMETGQALVMISGRTKFITWLPDYRDMFDFSNWTPPKKRLPKRNSPVTTFDISECTKKLRQNKMEAVLGTNHRPNGVPAFFDALNEPDVPLGDASKDATAMDVDSMIARIDAKIAELEAEEDHENKAEKIPYDIIVKHCGGRIHEVAREISMACSIPRTYVEKKLNDGTARCGTTPVSVALSVISLIRASCGVGKADPKSCPTCKSFRRSCLKRPSISVLPGPTAPNRNAISR